MYHFKEHLKIYTIFVFTFYQKSNKKIVEKTNLTALLSFFL